MKSLGVYYWYVKKSRCGGVAYGSEYITFYVQRHIAHLAACSKPRAGSRQAARGSCIYESRLLDNYIMIYFITFAKSKWKNKQRKYMNIWTWYLYFIYVLEGNLKWYSWCCLMIFESFILSLSYTFQML